MAGRFGEKREKLFHERPSGEKRDHFFCVRFIGSGGEFLREVAFGEGVIGRAVRFQDFFCEMPAVLRIGCDDDAADFLSGRGKVFLDAELRKGSNESGRRLCQAEEVVVDVSLREDLPGDIFHREAALLAGLRRMVVERVAFAGREMEDHFRDDIQRDAFLPE